MKFITDYFRNRGRNKIIKKIARLQKEAMSYQRNGNLRKYAEIMSEIAKLEEQINE